MSETTSKLSLFKYNTTADAKQPFSIKDCMNDNWDKLDAFATSVDTIFSSSFSSNLDKKVFSDINKELGKKLEADVLLAENGYIKFNKSIILQWGYVTMNWQDASVTITYPISYSDNPAVVTGKAYWNAHSNVAVYITVATTTTVTLHQYGYGSGAYWIALGQ